MRCYQIIDNASQTVVYEYWANAPYRWDGTHYPWASPATHTTQEARAQPEAPTLDPSEGVSLTVFDFVNRFTIAEHAGIVASTDPVVMAFLDRLHITAAQNRRVYASNSDTQGGLVYLTAANILADGRMAEILS